jgi:tetratricopeptide (TPR) repeat protein
MTFMGEIEEAAAELKARLDRYPARRYPIQHATAQFHLGVLLTNAGQLDEAAAALQTSSDLFSPDHLSVEHAKALNALGVVFRLRGRLADAAKCFEKSAALFEQSEAPLEEGAAIFNLGLLRRDLGDTDAAIRSFEAARELLDAKRVPAQAAAAVRELGVELFVTGELERAIAYLEEARDLAERANDRAGLGAAANSLGLTFLALEQVPSAIESFRAAIAANPRTIRPDAYAMGKANLALAYERAGEAPRARLAARQALRVEAAGEPVRNQASGTLERLGSPPGDLLTVLDGEESDHWPGILREELVWWAEADPEEIQTEAEAWITGLAHRGESAEDLAEAWLGALLELTPLQMERAITITLEVVGGQDQQAQKSFTSSVARAMPRFHSPQFIRIKDAFAQIAARLGLDGWS